MVFIKINDKLIKRTHFRIDYQKLGASVPLGG